MSVRWEKDCSFKSDAFAMEKLWGDMIVMLPENANRIFVGTEPQAKYFIIDFGDRMVINAYGIAPGDVVGSSQRCLHISFEVQSRKLIGYFERVGENVIHTIDDEYRDMGFIELRKQLRMALTNLREADLIFKLTNVIKNLDDPALLNQKRQEKFTLISST